MSPHPIRALRRVQPVRRFRRVIASSAVLVLGVLLLSVSSVTGNVFQGVGRADLKDQLSDANGRVAGLEAQLDKVKGEQECRSQIASNAEVYAGQLQVAVGRFVIAANAHDAIAARQAVTQISAASELLAPALDERARAVDLCAGRSTPPESPPAVTTTTTTSTIPAKPASRVRRPTSTTRTTAPVPTSRTTTTTSPPLTTCVDLFGVLCL